MDNIILAGHGSPKKDANNLEVVAKMLHDSIHPGCGGECVKVAYMEFAEPNIPDTLDLCARGGAEKVIVHPFFLSSGVHVTKDIPEMIDAARTKYPDVEFIYTEPLGIHQKLVEIVIDRIKSAKFPEPLDIERRSFEMISEEADMGCLPPEQMPIVKRVIHSTADFEFKKTLVFHPDAISRGIEAIRAGKDILTDIEMVKTGINKKLADKWGCRVICSINDDEVKRISEETGRTRSEIAMEKGLAGNVGIIAIGNAPTALLRVIELVNSESQILVVGVPVGFVNALESKSRLAAQKFPFITNLSRKGGTPVAVAIVNALLLMAGEGHE